MAPEHILQYCLDNLEGTVLVESWGERGIFYTPEGRLKRGVYVLTVKEKDGDNDKASGLDREGIYRVNVGVRKNTFIQLFGPVPNRPGKGGVVDMPVVPAAWLKGDVGQEHRAGGGVGQGVQEGRAGEILGVAVVGRA